MAVVIMKTVDVIDIVMLTYFGAKFVDVLLYVYCVQLCAYKHLVSKFSVQWIMLLCHVLMCLLHETHQVPYTGCPRRNVQYFGRVFLMLNYTDITQNTYIQS